MYALAQASPAAQRTQAVQQMVNRSLARQAKRQVPALGVVQRRAVALVDADLDAHLVAVSALPSLDLAAAAATIVAREAALAPLVLAQAALAAEVAAHGGGGVPALATLDDRVAAIDVQDPVLAADIAAAEGPAPAKPAVAWGGGGAAGAYLAWKAKHDNLAANRQKRLEIAAERAQLVGSRPVSVLQDKCRRAQGLLQTLQDNLAAAQRQCYFQLLMTTVAPTCTTYKDEGEWGDGPSVLGIFAFRGPGPLQNVPDRVGRVEVHVHFRKGSKEIKRAHIKEGWAYTILEPGGPPYAATALNACKATIAVVL